MAVRFAPAYHASLPMATDPPILLFSDAHFGAHLPTQEAEKTRRFVSFLHHAHELGAEVFFLGDLFDFWFEYKHWIPKHDVAITAAIREFTTAGGTFHLLIGNHDCWARDYFEKALGMTVHRDDVTMVRQGLRLFMSHGDGKAPSDRGYRLLRRVLRSRLSIWLYRQIPADWAFRLANFSSGRSRELTQRRPKEFLGEYDDACAKILQSGFDAVVLGHVHESWVKRVGSGWSVNTGDWYESFGYVVLENGEFRADTWH